MEAAALWVDVDGDARQDLVTASEWGPLRVFRNDSGQLRPLDAGLDGSPSQDFDEGPGGRSNDLSPAGNATSSWKGKTSNSGHGRPTLV